MENTGEFRSTDREIGEIKATLETYVKTQEKHNDKIEKKLDDMDGRLRNVEIKSVTIATTISVVGAIASLLFQSLFGNK